MAIEKQYVESLEDIVFKNRNHDYGSYYLRKRYRKYVTISLIFGFVLSGAIVAYPLINAYINKSRLIKEKEKEVGVEMRDMRKEEAPPPPPPPPPPEAKVEKVKINRPGRC
jgi:protein TonB